MSSVRTLEPLTCDRVDWCSPPAVIDRVRAFGGGVIGLDPASNPRSIVRATTEWMLERGDDGLAQRWDGHGLVYCNCPYGDGVIEHWTKACAIEGGHGVEVIALLPARTSSAWFQRDVFTADAICWWRGRLTFEGAPTSAPFASVLPYWGPRVREFIDLFRSVGRITTGSL